MKHVDEEVTLVVMEYFLYLFVYCSQFQVVSIVLLSRSLRDKYGSKTKRAIKSSF